MKKKIPESQMIDFWLRVLNEEINQPMELRVAKRLFDAGIREEDFILRIDHQESDPLRIKIANFLRDLERKIVCPKSDFLSGPHIYVKDKIYGWVFCKKCLKSK